MLRMNDPRWEFQLDQTEQEFQLKIANMVLDGVQDKLPQNMTPWQLEYFKWKEFEK